MNVGPPLFATAIFRSLVADAFVFYGRAKTQGKLLEKLKATPVHQPVTEH